jgi:hypothetical protein
MLLVQGGKILKMKYKFVLLNPQITAIKLCFEKHILRPLTFILSKTVMNRMLMLDLLTK